MKLISNILKFAAGFAAAFVLLTAVSFVLRIVQGTEMVYPKQYEDTLFVPLEQEEELHEDTLFLPLEKKEGFAVKLENERLLKISRDGEDVVVDICKDQKKAISYCFKEIGEVIIEGRNWRYDESGSLEITDE
ncbi:hypothetical protein STSP1_00949 [Sedimentisphaera salicampi]|uniref:Uncharacterized protein n=2 Tax=Sedimentisphaera salicampi TaxID=1941349 RepID=A0A1W6LLD7_9BACT|nr:hypothetical protein STSP1_00949 [Sedimentisphaera salicampi]